MGRTARDQRQPNSASEGKRSDAAASFKPLGIPALAAAVQASQPGRKPPAPERDLPAILRGEAFHD